MIIHSSSLDSPLEHSLAATLTTVGLSKVPPLDHSIAQAAEKKME